LEYASGRDDSEWDRLLIWTNRRAGGVAAIRMNDPRRFGRVSIDPDVSHRGVDVFAVTEMRLEHAFGRRRTSVKAVLLDQGVVAGLGNLCVDEVLWWAGVDPRRPVDGLAAPEVAAIATAIRRRLPIMLRRGGSTTGTINPQLRRSLGPCPRDGGELRRGVVGSRTTVWCARHQC
jgi:formamidopyrimidine-DNA glycosylase